ncbi:unnamed protein product [Protopolystoma xenopodis]|uniref:Uncharacterized protein n=1 Tax=Protopolystoma xenopodis TaxID=117903 RepID=A0A3S5FHD4_9PLAT|nr:unnamed protein product [Protopolystoma xenopodis]
MLSDVGLVSYRFWPLSNSIPNGTISEVQAALHNPVAEVTRTVIGLHEMVPCLGPRGWSAPVGEERNARALCKSGQNKKMHGFDKMNTD